MRLTIAARSLLLAAFATTATSSAASEPVFVRGTVEGAFVRLPHVRPAAVKVDQPDPRKLIITASGADFSSGSHWPKAAFVRHVQVFGPEYMGTGLSRVVLDLGVSHMSWRLQEDLNDTLVIIQGASPEAQLSRERRQQRREERLESLAAEREAERAAEAEQAGMEDSGRSARQEARREARREARGARDAKAAAPTPEDAELETLRQELAETRAQLRRLEGRMDGPAPAAAPEPRRNETARRLREEPTAPPAVREMAGSASPRVMLTEDGLARVPAGSFRMGTAAGFGFDDEDPEHLVRLSAFEIDVHEVTVGEFQHSPLTLPRQPDWNWGPDQPVVNVTWHEAAQYCAWDGKRLPTEAEWEKAARGTDARAYPWGNQWSATRSNSGVSGDGEVHAAPVGSLPSGASPYGAQDMAGNVWEWVKDWYDDDYFERSEAADPPGPPQGTYRVAKGGSFSGATAMNVRAAIRMPLKASARRDNVGFRCAR